MRCSVAAASLTARNFPGERFAAQLQDCPESGVRRGHLCGDRFGGDGVWFAGATESSPYRCVFAAA